MAQGSGALGLAVLAIGLGYIGYDALTSDEAEKTAESDDITTEATSREPDAATEDRCRTAKKVLVTALEESMTVRGGLERAQYVKSRENRTTINGFADGVYYVSAHSPEMDATLTWAVSKSMLSTGGGLAIGLGGTREVSDAGVEADPDKLGVRFGEGYNESRACVDGA